ncbi:hypothetical protein ACRRTK_017430 [Alexandromys fortis]
MCGELWLWALCALLLALWLLNFLRTDSDLTLLWAEWLGRRPEQVLTGKVVWVTGASSGIGEELALQLSKLGGSLVLSARRAQELERVKRRCLEHGNVKEKDILVLPLDLADRSSHEMATRTVLREFGRIDILINNAGIPQCSFVGDTSMDVFKEILEVNYLGTVSLTKCVLPHLMKRKQGKIVVMNSIAGIIPIPLCSAYVASKHALRVRLLNPTILALPKRLTGNCPSVDEGFLNTLQSELFNYPDIKVCTICPGPVHSNIFKNSSTSVVTKTREDNAVRVPKMETSRCVRLVLISMANDLNEVWIVKQPALFGLYLWQYVPLRDRLFSRMTWKKIAKAFYIDIGGLGSILELSDRAALGGKDSVQEEARYSGSELDLVLKDLGSNTRSKLRFHGFKQVAPPT